MSSCIETKAPKLNLFFFALHSILQVRVFKKLDFGQIFEKMLRGNLEVFNQIIERAFKALRLHFQNVLL